MEARVSSKGQIVIPAELRRKYGIKTGTRIFFAEENGGILLQPVTRAAIGALRGMFSGSNMLRGLEAERHRDREREDAGRSRRAR